MEFSLEEMRKRVMEASMSYKERYFPNKQEEGVKRGRVLEGRREDRRRKTGNGGKRKKEKISATEKVYFFM